MQGRIGKFLRNALGSAFERLAPGRSFYIWHADSEGYNVRGALVDLGIRVRQCLVWVKDRFVLGRQDYQWQHEPCLYGWKPGAAHVWMSDRRQTTTLECDRPAASREHPTMKPIALLGELIENSTRPGETVVDPFLGSGSTLLACEALDRTCAGVELDPRYCDVIVERWEQMTGQQVHRGRG